MPRRQARGHKLKAGWLKADRLKFAHRLNSIAIRCQHPVRASSQNALKRKSKSRSTDIRRLIHLKSKLPCGRAEVGGLELIKLAFSSPPSRTACRLPGFGSSGPEERPHRKDRRLAKFAPRTCEATYRSSVPASMRTDPRPSTDRRLPPGSSLLRDGRIAAVSAE